MPKVQKRDNFLIPHDFPQLSSSYMTRNLLPLLSLWRRKQQPTPVFLPREFHGQRSLVGYSPWDQSRTWLCDWEISPYREDDGLCHLPVGKWGQGDDPYRYLVGVESALCRHWNEQGKEFMAWVCSLKSYEPKWGKYRGGSDDNESACNARDLGLIPGEGRSSQEENGYPLPYSCLGNAMDRGAWWASVHGVAKSRILLNDYH